ncbi:DNA repair protein RecO [Sphingorhabdus sp. Alg239-R122]|uniref:DNA repair protein RecO n=1 Tax=Sphingorhabdus sp. Alg239-R122 TaxID=2305989 RepID=UPI0013DCC447|nr:DNA repair protein RecO [Sphingorhabdus sp. Alg239-R122]
MTVIRTDGIICTTRDHGEHGCVVRLFTPDNGLMAGYARGAKSRTKRPVLMPANLVSAEFRSRTADQLASVEMELRESRAPYYEEPLAAAAFGWATLLTATVLPEEQAYARLYSAFSALLDAIASAPSARGWSAALVRYELLLLAEMGFGLDLHQCVASGAEEELIYVSPKSGGAVSRYSAQGREHLLLPLPDFLLSGDTPGWDQIFDGLKLTGHFIERHFFDGYRADSYMARQMLLDRLKRAVA